MKWYEVSTRDADGNPTTVRVNGYDGREARRNAVEVLHVREILAVREIDTNDDIEISM